MVRATDQHEVRLASVALGRARHICAQSRDRDKRYEVLLPFIREGFMDTPLETTISGCAQ